MRPDKYLQEFIKPIFHTHRTKEIFNYNPSVPHERIESNQTTIFAYNYNSSKLSAEQLTNVEETFKYKYNEGVSWIKY